jgi:uncharacterized protein (DUF1330 family)
MIDIPLYMFANLVVTDAVSYQKYEKGLFSRLKKSGGEFGTCEDQPLHLEGNSPRPGRIIPSCFPSEEVSRNWFTDADYQALSNCRRAGTRREFLTLMHRLLPRQ